MKTWLIATAIVLGASTPALADPGHGGWHGRRAEAAQQARLARFADRQSDRWDRISDRASARATYAHADHYADDHDHHHRGRWSNRWGYDRDDWRDWRHDRRDHRPLYRSGYRHGRHDGYALTHNDRIYRARDGGYYCKKSDGTTGLIVGALGGGVLGHVIAPGDSKTLGSIIGGGLGAIIGKELDDNEVRCR